MANRTVNTALYVHGTNPQYLIDKTYRQRIYDSLYWKEHCFGLTVSGVMEKAVDLSSIGGCFGRTNRPTEFFCLLLKLLQLQPDRQMIDALIDQDDFKYLRALVLVYFRLTEKPKEIYSRLEPLYKDYRKLRQRMHSGKHEIICMDQLVDKLLTTQSVFSISLPLLTARRKMEDLGELPPRISPLDESDSDSESDSMDAQSRSGSSSDNGEEQESE